MIDKENFLCALHKKLQVWVLTEAPQPVPRLSVVMLK